jgi:hypothetical protein
VRVIACAHSIIGGTIKRLRWCLLANNGFIICLLLIINVVLLRRDTSSRILPLAGPL